MDAIAPGGKVKEFVVGCAFGPGIAVEMCMLKRNLGHVKRTLVISGQATPPESEGSRSETELDTEIKGAKETGEKINEKLKDVHPEVPEQNDSLQDVLGGVELD